jgi:hypothetical protein
MVTNSFTLAPRNNEEHGDMEGAAHAASKKAKKTSVLRHDITVRRAHRASAPQNLTLDLSSTHRVASGLRTLILGNIKDASFLAGILRG